MSNEQKEAGLASDLNKELGRVLSNEVKDLLFKVGNGEIKPKLFMPNVSWNDVWAGDVGFMVDGWKVIIFNDCDSFDYIDSVVSPDGREGCFDDWCGDGENWEQPDDMLYIEDKECHERMVAAFIEAV